MKIHSTHSAGQVSSTNKTDHHELTEILLEVALNTINLTLNKNKRVVYIQFMTI